MKQYYTEAVDFCSWADSLTAITEDNSVDLTLWLMKMYALSSSLLLPEDTDDHEEEYEYVVLRFTAPDAGAYWEIYDPYICDEPVCGSLVDDISSIYNDIRKGILLYEKGFLSDAQWEWKWSFENHWKFHAVDAIRALNSLKDGE